MTDGREGGWRGIAEHLPAREKAALLTLPLPYDADPVRWIAARPYGSTWRKSAKHRQALEALQGKAIVESRESRGETLWRLTRPVGHAVRRDLDAAPPTPGDPA